MYALCQYIQYGDPLQMFKRVVTSPRLDNDCMPLTTISQIGNDKYQMLYQIADSIVLSCCLYVVTLHMEKCLNIL